VPVSGLWATGGAGDGQRKAARPGRPRSCLSDAGSPQPDFAAVVVAARPDLLYTPAGGRWRGRPAIARPGGHDALVGVVSGPFRAAFKTYRNFEQLNCRRQPSIRLQGGPPAAREPTRWPSATCRFAPGAGRRCPPRHRRTRRSPDIHVRMSGAACRLTSGRCLILLNHFWRRLELPAELCRLSSARVAVHDSTAQASLCAGTLLSS
jgi:hypothetical protein